MSMQQNQMLKSAEFYDQAILQLRKQVWVGILLFTLFALIGTRSVRYLAGVKSTPIALAVQFLLYAVTIAGLWWRNSPYAPQIQTVYLACIHLVVPVVLLLYGGTRGFGDLALFLCIVVSFLYGWRRWMTFTFTFSTATLLYTLYLDVMGQPLNVFLEDTAQFASLKSLIIIGLVSFIIVMGLFFYRQLLHKHQLFADEQLRLTNELQKSARQLNDLTQTLQTSRQTIVTAREEERRHLRRELQGQIGPALAGLTYRAGAARNVIKSEPNDAAPLLDDLEINIKSTLDDMRSFVYALHPPLLDQLGLVDAIRTHAQKLDAPFEIAVNVSSEMSDVGAATELLVFRLVQTMLDSALKAEISEQITIELQADAASSFLNIVDINGGHPAHYHDAAALLLLPQSVDELGGTLQFLVVDGERVGDSAETHIRATIPT